MNKARPNVLQGEKGASLVLWMVILPVFLLIVLGGYQVWKARSVKESLRAGTYQATRYLSINPDTGSWIGTIRDDFVIPELANNGLVGEEIAQEVAILAPRPELQCGEVFIVRAQLPWRAVIPFLAREEWVIVAQYEGEVICAP